MKKFLVLLLVMMSLGVAKLSAQNYNWAIGVRGGFSAYGLTVKHNFDPANSVEAILDFGRGFNITALYERNIPVINQGFNFYYGAGANIGSWKKHDANKFTIGIDGIVGLEYKINSIPLAFSVDYKPCLNFIGRTGFFPSEFALGMKVSF